MAYRPATWNDALLFLSSQLFVPSNSWQTSGAGHSGGRRLFLCHGVS